MLWINGKGNSVLYFVGESNANHDFDTYSRSKVNIGTSPDLHLQNIPRAFNNSIHLKERKSCKW